MGRINKGAWHTMTQKVLVVEDETDVKNLMVLHLQREGYEVLAVENGEEALDLIRDHAFQLVILDWMLPALSGLEICKRLNRSLPVLMVTARGESSEIVLG